MKAKQIYLLLSLLVLTTVPFIVSASQYRWKSKEQSKLVDNQKQNRMFTIQDTGRQSITFILGDDEKGAKPYYSLAFDYYRTDKFARTENINNTCRSLSEVRDYLRDNPPGNGRPWGLIHLVSHGNEWYGLSVPVEPGSKRSSTDRLDEFVNEGKFESLSDQLIDDSTEIFLHGCGLGNDQELLQVVSKAFGGKGKRPLVTASKLKEYYFSMGHPNQQKRIQLYYAQTWKIYYQFKSRPDNETLKQEFAQRYPEEKVDWEEALKYTNPAVPSDVFHYEVNIPVYYTVKYASKDSLPDLSSDEKKLKFIKSQKKFAGLIGKSKIPFEKFTWTTKRIYVTDDKNKKQPAISITGWCTVLCVVKPLIMENQNSGWTSRPYYPAKTDTTYFGIS